MMRGIHDLGGLDEGTVPRAQHDFAFWEKRVDALFVLLSAKGIIRVDELRRGIESLGAEAYASMSYYERWISALTEALLEHGVVTIDELSRRMAEIETRQAAGP
jgi:hypothetical protein